MESLTDAERKRIEETLADQRKRIASGKPLAPTKKYENMTLSEKEKYKHATAGGLLTSDGTPAHLAKNKGRSFFKHKGIKGKNTSSLFKTQKGEKKAAMQSAMLEWQRKAMGGKLTKGKLTAEQQKGDRLAREIIGPKGLERLGDDPAIKEAEAMKKGMIGKMEEQTARQRDLTSRYEKMAEQGISPAEQEAIRSKTAKQMMESQQLAGLRLGGALGGAQGAAAAAQQRSLMAQGMQARAGIERDIFLASEEAKRAGLAGMGTALGAERASLAGETGALADYTTTLGNIRQFDIGQAAKERDIRLQTITNAEQMAMSERMAKMQGEAAQAAIPKRQKFLGLF